MNKTGTIDGNATSRLGKCPEIFLIFDNRDNRCLQTEELNHEHV